MWYREDLIKQAQNQDFEQNPQAFGETPPNAVPPVTPPPVITAPPVQKTRFDEYDPFADEEESAFIEDPVTPGATKDINPGIINQLDQPTLELDPDDELEQILAKEDDPEKPLAIQGALKQMEKLEAENPDLTITAAEDAPKGTAISVRNLTFSYGNKQTLNNISLDIPENQITALIGPSGCGKSTFLRCLNRMNDLLPGTQVQGTINAAGNDVYAKETNVDALRRQVGMIEQKPNPLPMTIYDNVAFGLRLQGIQDKNVINAKVTQALMDAGLYEEVKDRIHTSAMKLSGGQQQRLCIARAIAVEPQILLMDEPCSALDPKSTKIVEDLIKRLAGKFTVVVVTHNMQQAQRISQNTAMFYEGQIAAHGNTEELFKNPPTDIFKDYVEGYFS